MHVVLFTLAKHYISCNTYPLKSMTSNVTKLGNINILRVMYWTTARFVGEILSVVYFVRF